MTKSTAPKNSRKNDSRNPSPKAPLVSQSETSASSATERPAIVLIHGFRGSPIGLEAIAKDLRAAGFSVHIPKVPPFAGAGNLERYTPERYAKFVTDYIAKHGLSQPVLIGHSMGSIISAATAAHAPEVINQKLILLSPISTKPAKFFAALTPLSALLPCKIVDYVTTRYLFAAKDRELFRETMDLTHRCSSDHPPKKSAVFASAKFSAGFCIRDFEFSHETLIIAGEKDRLIKQSATKDLAASLEAKLVFLPGTGHLHNYEQPHETATAILRFLEQPS